MSKKNKKNAPVTPVVVDEVAQTPAAADVPTIDVQQSVPDVPAAENAHEIAPSSETIATNGHAFALPVTEIPLEIPLELGGKYEVRYDGDETPYTMCLTGKSSGCVLDDKTVDPAGFTYTAMLVNTSGTNSHTTTGTHATIDPVNVLEAETGQITVLRDITETPAAATEPAAEPVKEKLFQLRLTADQLETVEHALITHSANLNTAALEKLTPVLQMIERAKKAPVTGNGTGTGLKVFDKYSPIAILNWMGAHGFTQYDAKNALRHFGVDTDEIAKTTWSRALAKGKKPADNKVKIIGDLSPEQELELMNFYNLAAREAAKEAEQRIDATRARIKQLPAVQQ